MRDAATYRQLDADAVRRGEPGYVDPDSGLFVLTSAYLEARGYCCGSGCRHCPYPPDAWPPQKRRRRGA